MSDPTPPSDPLDDFRVPDAGNLFVIGSFDQRVTFYSQQLRALNLVDALVRADVVGKGGKLLIIGAGLAGLTAAAAAARLGITVRVLEKQEVSLPTFRGCSQRFIHPRIYDWPATGWNDSRARLPVLDWAAAPAADVATQVLRAFDKVVLDVSEQKLRVDYGVHGIKLMQHSNRLYKVAWKPGTGMFVADAVVLAVGFGVESVATKFPPVNRYWDDDDIIGFREGEGTWFVSGCGDGGLTDVLRARLRDFRHETLVPELLQDRTELGPIEERLLEIERDNTITSDRFLLTTAYVELSTPKLDEQLRARLRNRRVILNSTGEAALSKKASILNRFLVSRFLDRGNDKLSIEYVAGSSTFTPTKKRGTVVEIAGHEPIRADRVIIRRGPEEALKKGFPEIYEKAHKSLTEATRHERARRPAWQEGRFGPEVGTDEDGACGQDRTVERAYLEQLRSEFGLLDLKGFSGTNKQIALPLDRVYVELRSEPDTGTERMADRGLLEADVRERMRKSGGDADQAWTDELLRDPYVLRAWHRPRDTQGRPLGGDGESIPLSHVVHDHRRLVILGDPGCGKTTLLRYLAIRHAHARLTGELRATGTTATEGGIEDLGPTRLPIYVRIAEYAEACRDAKTKPEMLQILATTATRPQSHIGVDNLRAMFMTAMARGEALVLLDGLDEVPAVTDRQTIAQDLEAWIVEVTAETHSSTGPGNQVLCTSRIAGYRAAPLRERIAHQVIQDLSDKTIEVFMQRWCRAVEDQLAADLPEAIRAERAKAAEQALRAELTNPRVRRLAVNPLMLTLLALLQRTERGLPRLRIELYRCAVRTLLETWRKTGLTEEQVLHLLGPIATWLHEHRPLGLIAEEELRRRIFEGLCAWDGYTPEIAPVSLEQSAIEFIDAVRHKSGIILARGERLYGFVHLSFQEYFVARYIARQTATLCTALTEHAANSRWYEPLILAIGHISREMHAEVAPLFTHLLELKLPHEDLLGRGLSVCLGALVECAWAPPEIVRQIVVRTLAVYGDAQAAGRKKLCQRIVELFTPLRTAPFSSTIERVLVQNMDLLATKHLVTQTRWFSRATIAALLECAVAPDNRSQYAESALRIAGSEAPELFPDSLGIRSAARVHEDKWRQLLAQPGLGTALRALVTRTVYPIYYVGLRPRKKTVVRARMDSDIITQETALDEQLRRALASTTPIQELFERCRDLCSRRAPGWEDAAALLILGRPEIDKIDISLEPNDWKLVFEVSFADAHQLAVALKRLGITIPRDDEWEPDPPDGDWEGEEDDDDESIEFADVNEQASEVTQALGDLENEDDQQRDQAQRVMNRRRRMSIHAHILPVLADGERDSNGFAGTVMADALHNFTHDDPRTVVAWMEQARLGEESCMNSLAGIRSATQNVLDAVVAGLGAAVPETRDPAELPIAYMAFQLLRGDSTENLVPLVLRLLRSPGPEVRDVVYEGLLAKSLASREICEVLAEHLEGRSTPALLLAAARAAKTLRKARDRWTATHDAEELGPDPSHTTVQRLEQAIGGCIHHVDPIVHRAALGAMLRMRKWRSAQTVAGMVQEFGISERESLQALLNALRDQEIGWRRYHEKLGAAAADILVRSPDLLPLLFDEENRMHTREWLGVLDAVAAVAPALVSGYLDTTGELPEILKATQHSHAWDCRMLAFKVLGRLRQLPREVGEALLAGTRDVSSVRQAASQAAGRMHAFDIGALDVLLAGLSSRSNRTVRAATTALGAMATSRVLLEDSAVRERVVDALAVACRQKKKTQGNSLYGALFAVAASEPVLKSDPPRRFDGLPVPR